MGLQEDLVGSSIFPGEDINRLIPENVRSVFADLKKDPTAYLKWLYGSSLDEIYQGDVLQNLSAITAGDDGEVVAREGPALVVSQTCDCQPSQGEFILIAPVFPLQEMREQGGLSPQTLDNFVRDLRGNRLKDQIFLPAIAGLPDSWVDFSQICPISSQYFHSKQLVTGRKRLASLSQKGHYFFLMRLSFYLCHPDPADSKRGIELNNRAQEPETKHRRLKEIWNGIKKFCGIS